MQEEAVAVEEGEGGWLSLGEYNRTKARRLLKRADGSEDAYLGMVRLPQIATGDDDGGGGGGGGGGIGVGGIMRAHWEGGVLSAVALRAQAQQRLAVQQLGKAVGENARRRCQSRVNLT